MPASAAGRAPGGSLDAGHVRPVRVSMLPLAGAIAGAALALVPAGPGWARAAALTLVLGVVPGALVARRLLPRWTSAARAALGLGLSPFLTAAPAALLMSLGVSLALAARAVALAVAVLAALEAWRRSAPAPDPAAAREARDPTPWRVALAGTAAAGALLLANPALVGRSDGAFHAAVTLAVARGGVPPEDPYFAGLRLLYFWGAHVWAALWLSLAPALAVWTPLATLNLLAALAALLGVCELARRLGGTRRAQWLAAGLAAFGAAPFAWGWDALRAMSGEVRCLAELRRLITLGVDPALASMSLGLLHPSLVFAADKFLVLTPFAPGLALLLGFALVLIETLERPRSRAPVALGLVVAAALFVHAVVGAALLACGAAVWLGVAFGRGRPPLRAAAGPLALSLAAPALVLAPYLAAITRGRPAGVTGGLSWTALSTLVAGGALVVPAGLAWLWRGRSPSRTLAARALVPAVLALAAAGLVVRASGDNQSKLFNLLFLLVSAPAALGWRELRDRFGPAGRAGLAGLLGLATLPTALLCLWAYAAERGQSEYSFHPPAPLERAAYAWARDSLPPDAVLVDRATDAGSAATLTIATRRSLLWGGAAMARKWGYAPGALDLRRRAAEELATGGPLASDVTRFVRGLGRDIVVVGRRPPSMPEREFARAVARPAEHRVRLYANPDVAFLGVGSGR